MTTLETTKMSSKGQVVIPEEIRNRLGLKAGDQFLVMSEKDVVILKTLTKPSMDEFDTLIKTAKKQAKLMGLKKADIESAITESRKHQ
jgi:AbrB family looped-hinge helix DNA binding protein